MKLQRCSQVRFASGRPLQSDVGPGYFHPVTHESPQQQPAGLQRTRRCNTLTVGRPRAPQLQDKQQTHHGGFGILGEYELADSLLFFLLNAAGRKQPLGAARCPRPTVESPADRTAHEPEPVGSTRTRHFTASFGVSKLADVSPRHIDSHFGTENVRDVVS